MILGILGGIVVIADLLGTGTWLQYFFNFVYLAIALPVGIGLWFKMDDYGKC